MKIAWIFICFSVLSGIFPSAALSDVIVYDVVALKGQEVMLKAETRGTLLSKSGEVVEFIVNGKSYREEPFRHRWICSQTVCPGKKQV